ncbi:MAG TPA: hypothetical protein EYM54_05340, partial [Dehalococcoidia bacterium]|nr:hypothetical protein [Dehalococcoidia bacterium]
QAFLSAATRGLEGHQAAVDLTTVVEQPTTAVDDVQAQDSLAGGVFVGRLREMDDLQAALEDALSGRGRLVALSGEPGIGKTRTAQELGVLAMQRGALVLWGRCYEDEGVPPYWPWVQAIRSYIREKDPEELRSEMGAGAQHIAEIISEILERLPGLGTPPQVEPEQARFRLFDAITTFLKNAVENQPIMLVLDDLQWADRSSLLFLEYLVREIRTSRLLLLVTYRTVDLSPEHPLARTIDVLNREGQLQRVSLSGHTQSDVARLIEVTAGVSPPEDFVEAVHTQTEGNPLFITEVVRLLMQEGDLTAYSGATWTVRIPEGVREVIGRRLNGLSQEANEILTIASVSGREFDPTVIAPLIEDTNEDQLREVLQEAMAALLIEELPRGHYQFTHALVREKFAEEMSQTRKAGLHATIGETLEEIYGVDVEPHAAELAHHFREAQTAVGIEKLVHYSLLAGEQAIASYAYEDALAHFERGLAGKGVELTGTEPAPDAESAALLSGLGRAELGTRERQTLFQALPILTRAFDYYVAAGDSEQAVAIAVQSQDGFGFIDKALELATPGSHDAGRLMSRSVRGLRANYEKAQEAINGALVIAQEHHDSILEMETLMVGACVDFTYCRFEESLDRNRRAVSLAEQVERPSVESHARYDLVHVLYAMGDSEEAAQHASALMESAERSGSRQWQTFAMEANENLSSARGDWQTARDFAEQGLAMSPRETDLLGCRAILEYQTGNFEPGRAYLEQLLENVWPSPSSLAAFTTNTVPAVVIPLAAYISGEITRFDEAESIALSILDSPSGFPSAQHAARIGLALIAVQRGDAMAAGKLYGAIEPLMATMSPQGPFGPGLSADRILGLVSQTMGNLNQACEHFEDVLDFCRKAGYQPELA